MQTPETPTHTTTTSMLVRFPRVECIVSLMHDAIDNRVIYIPNQIYTTMMGKAHTNVGSMLHPISEVKGVTLKYTTPPAAHPKIQHVW